MSSAGETQPRRLIVFPWKRVIRLLLGAALVALGSAAASGCAGSVHVALPEPSALVRVNPLKGHVTFVQWEAEYPSVQFRFRAIDQRSGQELWMSDWAQTPVIAPYRGPMYSTVSIPVPPPGMDLRQVQIRLVALAFVTLPGSGLLYRGCMVDAFWIDPAWRPYRVPLYEHLDHGWERVVYRGHFAPRQSAECVERWQR